MASNNSVNLIGRLTKEPELQKTNTGLSIINFTLAVDGFRKNADGSKKCNFIFCTAWKKTAETIATYCHKGSQIGVAGYIDSEQYTDSAGNNKVSFRIQVQDITMLGSKSTGSAQTNHDQYSDVSANFTDVELESKYVSPEDLPF